MSRLSNTAKTVALLGGMFALNSMDAAHAQTQPAETQSPPFTKTEQMVATGTVSRFDGGEEKESLVVVLGRDTLVVQPNPQGDAHLVMGDRGVSANGGILVELLIYRDSMLYYMKDAKEPFNRRFEQDVSLDQYSVEGYGSVDWTHLQSNKNTMANQNTEQTPIEELQAIGTIDIQLSTVSGNATYMKQLIMVDPQGEVQVLEKDENGKHWLFEMTDVVSGNIELHLLDDEGQQHSQIPLRGSLGLNDGVKVSVNKYDPERHGAFNLQWLDMKPGIEGTLPVEPAPTRKESPKP